jgi:hypothetical protein
MQKLGTKPLLKRMTADTQFSTANEEAVASSALSMTRGRLKGKCVSEDAWQGEVFSKDSKGNAPDRERIRVIIGSVHFLFLLVIQ